MWLSYLRITNGSPTFFFIRTFMPLARAAFIIFLYPSIVVHAVRPYDFFLIPQSWIPLAVHTFINLSAKPPLAVKQTQPNIK